MPYDFETRSAAQASAIPSTQQTLHVGGYARLGDGGDAFYQRVNADPGHRGAFADASGGWWEIAGDEVNVASFGAVRNGDSPSPTSDTAAIQDAINYISARSAGGVVRFSRGVYALGGGLLSAKNVRLKGRGIGLSILKLIVDGHLLGANGESSFNGGSFEIEDLTLWGYADRLSGAGTEAQRMINLQWYDRVAVRRVEVCYSRFMGLTMKARQAVVEDCHVHHTNRDGINIGFATNVVVTGNVISRVGDDAIAVHSSVAPGQNASAYERRTVIANNVVEFSAGIKCVGARNTTVVNNSLRFVMGYFVDLSVAPPEGVNDLTTNVIANNVCSDLINLNSDGIGGGDVCRGIYVKAVTPTAGTEAPVPAGAPGRWTAGTIVKPEPYINTFGAAKAHGGGYGVIISGNTLTNTLSGLTHFSDAGYGKLWWNAGEVDPEMAGTIGIHQTTSRGIVIGSSMQNAVVSGNIVDSYATGLYLAEATYLRNIAVTDNVFRRCRTWGADLAVGGADKTGDLLVADNVFDIDPFFEHPHRAADGSWDTSAPTGSGYGLNLNATVGVVVRGCVFKNAKGPVSAVAGGYQCALKDNSYVGDPAALQGMTFYPNIRENDLVWVDSNPTAATYGTNRSIKNSTGNFTAAPASGGWMAGQFVPNAAPASAGGKVLLGWIRLTTGTANILNTDWAPVYGATS
ncbi:right-handed parallel beta-helix repeat-containing protein [Inquilinus limosus]|uniref:Rhamnogalacturonase A/B/Epimerase-like pectate lyase domain-containing protein n=1 Tax=Inquilinus limosus MP06 TaxID=1398085 RepID=A0A0A0D3G5_9PROT|nr:right-handed parallel beta-helix repeat-containing protein [Inquilinus limosus]KGM32570.1 hypothetical protein P409_20630 [Inquilinus limosus MP06]